MDYQHGAITSRARYVYIKGPIYAFDTFICHTDEGDAALTLDSFSACLISVSSSTFSSVVILWADSRRG